MMHEPVKIWRDTHLLIPQYSLLTPCLRHHHTDGPNQWNITYPYLPNVWFQKVSIHTDSMEARSLEIPRGRGVLKAKLLEEKYEAKLEFPGGWGAKQKPSVGRVWVFSGTTEY